MRSTKETMSPRAAALRLNRRLDAVYALIWAGRLKARKSNGRWLVECAAVEDRLARQRKVGDRTMNSQLPDFKRAAAGDRGEDE